MEQSTEQTMKLLEAVADSIGQQLVLLAKSLDYAKVQLVALREGLEKELPPA